MDKQILSFKKQGYYIGIHKAVFLFLFDICFFQYPVQALCLASLMGINVATLRNWEQGRRKPEGPARVLLMVAAKHPEVLLDLAGSQKKRANK